MNGIQLNSRGGPDALAYGPAAVPRPGAGEILVRVRAAAVTPTELLWVTTWTTRAGEPRPFPIIPGHEFSGEVHGVGPGVNDVAVGEAVFGMNDFFGDGTQAEFCVARTVDVAPKPKSVDHVTAAVVPISALTAWQGLAERAKEARSGRAGPNPRGGRERRDVRRPTGAPDRRVRNRDRIGAQRGVRARPRCR